MPPNETALQASEKTVLSSILDPVSLKILVYVLGQLSISLGLRGLPQVDVSNTSVRPWIVKRGDDSNGRRLDVYNIVNSLYDADLLVQLGAFLRRRGVLLSTIPTLVLLGVYSRSFVPWAISRYARASIKLKAGEYADTTEYIVKWAAKNAIGAGQKSADRHLVMAERRNGVGDHQETYFKILRSGAESWTVVWEERKYYIRLARRQEPKTNNRYNNGQQPFGQGQHYCNNCYDNGYDEDYDDLDEQYDDQYCENSSGSRGSSRYRDNMNLDYVLIECHGKDSKPIVKLIEHCKKEMQVAENKEYKVTIVHKQAGGGEVRLTAPGRPINTLDLPTDLKALVQDALEFFDPQVKLWFRKMGTPWRRGFLLYGPPGTGKTSFATALATELRLPIYTIALAGSNDDTVTSHFNNLPDTGCIVLLEDIDSAGLIRDNDQPAPKAGKVKDGKLKNKRVQDERQIEHVHDPHHNVYRQAPSKDLSRGVTMSRLINLIDGVGSKEGRLLLMTTNRLNSVDERLFRDGRAVNPPFLFGYSDKETAAMTFRRMFGSYPINPLTGDRLEELAKAFGDQCPKHYLTPANLQEYCNAYRGRPDAAVAEFRAYIKARRKGKAEILYDMDEKPMVPEFDFPITDDEEDSSDSDDEDDSDEDSESESDVADSSALSQESSIVESMLKSADSESSIRGDVTWRSTSRETQRRANEKGFEARSQFFGDEILAPCPVGSTSEGSCKANAPTETANASAEEHGDTSSVVANDTATTFETSPAFQDNHSEANNLPDDGHWQDEFEDLDAIISDVSMPLAESCLFPDLRAGIQAVLTQLYIGFNSVPAEDDSRKQALRGPLREMSPRPISDLYQIDRSTVSDVIKAPSELCEIDWEDLEKYDDVDDQGSFWSLRTLSILAGERFMTGYEA